MTASTALKTPPQPREIAQRRCSYPSRLDEEHPIARRGQRGHDLLMRLP